jgi:hypothetical protein
MCLQRSTTLFDPFENLEFAQESSKAKNCLVGPRVTRSVMASLTKCIEPGEHNKVPIWY